ncbi:MAG: sigma-54 dependent transcriptional regulator [Thermoanaerobaculia bacterium]
MLIRVLLLVEATNLRTRLLGSLTDLGVVVFAESDPTRLWDRLGQENYDLVVATRNTLPDDVEGSIAAIRKLPDRPEVIVLIDSAQQKERAALQAAGAFAVIDQNLSMPPLFEALDTVLSRYREIGVSRQSEEHQRQSKLDDFSSESPVMRRLLELARRVVASNTSLLILGETGVGKEWLARAIHAEGTRREAPFIAVNCAAVPETLLESELFGHERGAFTGAVRARRGCFEMSHRGTLFLDEIADVPVHLQAKLLRALQERNIQRLGAEKPVQVDVRVMAATNQDLEAAMEDGRFRRDLFYRLSVVTLTVPPLRDRREDIAPLVENYLAEFRQQLGRLQIEGIEESALARMLGYGWPGNVRELINVVERAVLLCDGPVLSSGHLPDAVSGRPLGRLSRLRFGPTSPGFDSLMSGTLEDGRSQLVDAFEREYLSRLLAKTAGNIGGTAHLAGIDPRTLYNKMKAYGLRKKEFRRQGG